MVIFTNVWSEQTVTSLPAEPVGALVIVSVLDETASEHGEFPAAVNVRVMEPALMSAILGVYVQPVSEVAFVSVPAEPVDVHRTPLLLKRWHLM